jgi:hypothetical protein
MADTTGRIVSTPPRGHSCDPGWQTCTGEDGTRYGIPPASWDYPKGTVWECGCGRTWVSRGAIAPNSPGFVDWRREGRRSRWRRERRPAPVSNRAGGQL